MYQLSLISFPHNQQPHRNFTTKMLHHETLSSFSLMDNDPQPQQPGTLYRLNQVCIRIMSRLYKWQEYFTLQLLPFVPLVWMFAYASNVINGWSLQTHQDRPRPTATNDVADNQDNVDIDENDTNHFDNGHHPSDDFTITEFDDDDSTTTMDVDTDLDGPGLPPVSCSSIIQETKPKKSLYTMNDFHRHRILGSGQFGQVWLVSEKDPSANQLLSVSTLSTKTAQTLYALKVISKYDLIVNDEVDMIVREKNIMHQLTKEEPHPFIVQLHAAFQSDNFLFLVQEFCPGGEIFSLMHRNDTNLKKQNQIRLPVDQVAFYTLCIADALEFMHTHHKIVYRDLKPENVMLDARGYPKLIDMGYAKVLHEEDEYTAYTFCGTPNYIAPEMIQMSSAMGCSFQVDHWALGILVHEMLFGSHPFNSNDDMDQMELFNCICYDEFTAATVTVNEKNDLASQNAMTHLISQLLTKDPQQRLGRTALGGSSICSHPAFATTANHNYIHELRKRIIRAPWIPPSSIGNATGESTATPDRFQEQYPTLSKREKALFDAF